MSWSWLRKLLGRLQSNGTEPAKKDPEPGHGIREETARRRRERDAEDDPTKTACEGLRKAVEDRQDGQETLILALRQRGEAETAKGR